MSDARQVTKYMRWLPARVTFMGSLSRRLWWDVELRGRGYVVVRAGRFKRPELPRVYWSPNATPWHHEARSIFRAGYVSREKCVCGESDCTTPKRRG